MASIPSNVDQARAQLRQARHKASPFIEKFARFGYAAKGLVYCVVGVLAAMAAIGSGGQTTGSKGALQTIGNQPFGQILLGVVAAGLAGYALWQFIRSIEDPEDEGSDGKAIAKRIGFFISGTIHFGLVIYALGILLGNGGGGEDDGARTWSAKAMSYPMGRWLLAAVGMGIIGYGLVQLRKSFKSNLGDRLHLGELGDGTRRLVINISRGGLAARGIVFAIIGSFLAVAAWRHNPDEARGVEGALETVQRQPYGPWLLGVVAIGLIAYGIFEFAKARYRRISPS